MRALAVTLTILAALTAEPARGQAVYGPGFCGPGVVQMGRPPAGQHHHSGFKPGISASRCPSTCGSYAYGTAYPYAYWGSNPYLSFYYGYAAPVIYSPPVYIYPPDYAAPPAAASAPPPPARDDARLPPPVRLPEPEANVAYIDLQVPAAAQVWAQGVKMAGQGNLRRFVTPTLEPGSHYSYEFRIVYPEGGKEVTLVRHLSVAAGDRKSLTIIESTAQR